MLNFHPEAVLEMSLFKVKRRINSKLVRICNPDDVIILY